MDGHHHCLVVCGGAYTDGRGERRRREREREREVQRWCSSGGSACSDIILTVRPSTPSFMIGFCFIVSGGSGSSHRLPMWWWCSRRRLFVSVRPTHTHKLFIT
ncbi:hypothetical protein Hanom_Chr16g01418961 [Helianthus anomalus]